MRGLVRLSAVLTIVMGCALLIARSVGHAYALPAANLANWFTNADGTPCDPPCLFGLRPGATRYSDVHSLVAAHPLTHDMFVRTKSRHAWTQFLGEKFSLTVYPDDNGSVGTLLVMFTARAQHAPDVLSMGEVIAVLGIPDVVQTGLTSQPIFTSMVYAGCELVFGLPDAKNVRLVITHPLAFVGLRVGFRMNADQPNLRIWQGFTTIEHYTASGKRYDGYHAPAPCTVHAVHNQLSLPE